MDKNNNKNNANHKTPRVVDVNAYMNSNAKFNWSLYFASYITVWFSVFTTVLFTIHFLETMDYLKALGKVENDLIVFIKYFATHTMGMLNNLNHLNDLIGQKVFSFDIPLLSPNLSLEGWVLICFSGLISLIFLITPLYQLYFQRTLKTSNYENYFVPQILLHKFWNRKKSKRVYIRLLPELKGQKIEKDHNPHLFIHNFFDIEATKTKDYKLLVEAKKYFTFFDYLIIHLIENDSKKKELLKNEEKTISKDKGHTKQNQKVSSDNGKLKSFFE